MLRLVMASTSIHVPKVIAWNSDYANCAGAEYMIFETVHTLHFWYKFNNGLPDKYKGRACEVTSERDIYP